MNGFERHPYIPNSVPEVQQEMLQELGMSSLEELHKNVPELLKLKKEMDLPPAFESEYALRRHVEGLLGKDTSCKKNLNFLGAGCWQHYVPALCDEINSRGEFLTGYGGEPYNELGRFQSLFEYASMVAELVGMDVVKRSIEALRGRIELDSTVGKGTTLTIRLPLTLAIIDGLQVLVGGESYVIPLNHVEECAEHATPSAADGRQRIINLRGEIVPYIRLRELFASSGPAPAIEQVVVVDAQGSRFGLVVDCVVGEHQTVIKSLGRIYKDVPGISGATIKGDGSMALILDVPGLVQLAADQPQRGQRVPAASHGGGA